MDVSDAIRTAKQYVQTVFQDDSIADVELEEVQFESGPNTWAITIGFVKNRVNSANALNPLALILERAAANRIYKIVRVSNEDGQPLSVKNRPID